MEDNLDASCLTLAEALVAWCDPVLVEAVPYAEAPFTETELWQKGRFHLGGAETIIIEASQYAHRRQVDPESALDYAWDILIKDFQRRIQAYQIYLSGVQTDPERQAVRMPIPSLWAADFEFDFINDAVRVGSTHRYVSVRASRSTPDQNARSSKADPPELQITTRNVAALESDVLIAVLEEYTKRIIADPTAKLRLPGKLTVMPMIQGKMRYRADRNELLATAGAEAEFLHDWASERVELHSVPKAPTIEKVLGKEYALLKARSKPAIQKLSP